MKNYWSNKLHTSFLYRKENRGVVIQKPSFNFMQIAVVGWYLLAGFIGIIFVIALLGHFSQTLVTISVQSSLNIQSIGTLVSNGLRFLFPLSNFFLSVTLAWVVFRQQTRQLVSIVLAYFLLLSGLLLAGPIESLEPFVPGITEFTVFILTPALLSPITFLLLAVFPDGQFVPSWTRWFVLLSLLVGPQVLIIAFQADWNMSDPLVINAPSLWTIPALILLYAQVQRFRNVSTPEQRLQTRWVVFGLAAWFLLQVPTTAFFLYEQISSPDAPLWSSWLGSLFWYLSISILPVSLTIAITRYRLYDIDFIINRTIVYGALSAIIIVFYMLVVGGFSLLFQSSGNLFVAILATGFVAVLFQPLRNRLQQAVNRFMFGEREDPAKVLSQLGQQLEQTVSPQATLSGIVQTIKDALKLPYAAIEFVDGNHGESRIAASAGSKRSTIEFFPIIFQTERVGQLVVAHRSPDEAFTEADTVILTNIARQAGAAAQAAKLAADLQLSRQQLVSAREEERRRMRRDLHDGLGPSLASQTLTLSAMEKHLKRDPAAALPLLQILKDQSQTAIGDIRQLVYELRPPALDELGLLGAIREIATDHGQNRLQIDVQVDGELPALPAATEVAAYRIAQEALTNAIRHGEAEHCIIRFDADKENESKILRLEIIDDGQGLSNGATPGVGLNSMRERAEELGGSFQILSPQAGGTHILARLPLLDNQS